MIKHYFSIKKDIAIVNNGGFFCKACLVGKPANELSPDHRYCIDCYNFLTQEAELLPLKKRPKWIPKNGGEPQKEPENPIQVAQYVDRILSTVKRTKNAVDKITPATRIKTARGRKPTGLPIDTLRELYKQGFGYKMIAGKLKESGIVVSYRTVARALKGERL